MIKEPQVLHEDETEQLLKRVKHMLLAPEQLSSAAPSCEFLPCDKCKVLPARKLPCVHNLCEGCIAANLSDEFDFVCPICAVRAKGIPESNGYFVHYWGIKDNDAKAKKTDDLMGNEKGEVKMFSEDDLFLNFQFLTDLINKSLKAERHLLGLSYFVILRNPQIKTSNVSLKNKKLIFVHSFPVAATKSSDSTFEATKDCARLSELCALLQLRLSPENLLSTVKGRANRPITVTLSSCRDAPRFNLGTNVLLANEVLQEVALMGSASPAVAKADFGVGMRSEGLNVQECEQLPPESEAPLKCKNTPRFTYRSLVDSLFQAPCNEFEEKIMRAQKYKDFKNPIFSLNNELITQAKEIVGSLTVKASASVDPLPRCDNFSFDLYQQIKCNKYRYCAQCSSDSRSDKTVYAPSVSSLAESEQKLIAAYKCTNCKKYLCPTCANLHKIDNMDHIYQFKVDKKDYESVRRLRQGDVVKTMHDLIKEKVRCVLEKVNNDVFAHLKGCIDESEGKYSANN
eukprot:TRINITY_DN10641_c0_g1_i9.p1 TRINITY_DN10641_c0_g1~~TRINITY_DN10641_c0_g1_i9.p1  ORF type:complete len:513 (-),score=128.90 TRINITY_DN10641_c0_g1_i9:173-1711(-)